MGTIFVIVLIVVPTDTATRAGATQGHLLTASTAQEVFSTRWPKFALAYATGNMTQISRYVDSDVEKAIKGWFYCGCGPWPTAYRRVNMSAPPQSSYPLSFLAEIQAKEYSTQADVIEVVFTKTSSRSPWLISYLVPYVDGTPYLTHTTMNTVAPPTTFDIARVGTQFASYFQTVDLTGQPPPNSWPQTGSIAQETNRIQNSLSALKTNDLSETLTYSAGPHSLDFAAPGEDLMCGEVRSHSVITPKPGVPIVQPPDQGLFTPALKAGSYSSVTSNDLSDACWDVSPTGTATPIAFFGGLYSRIGIPTTVP
jgi:hypothetical protein